MTAIALAVVLGITGLGLTLSASAADESVQARSAWKTYDRLVRRAFIYPGSGLLPRPQSKIDTAEGRVGSRAL